MTERERLLLDRGRLCSELTSVGCRLRLLDSAVYHLAVAEKMLKKVDRAAAIAGDPHRVLADS